MKDRFCQSPGTGVAGRVMEWGAEKRHFPFSPLKLILKSSQCSSPLWDVFFFVNTIFQEIEVCIALLMLCNRENVFQPHIMEFDFLETGLGRRTLENYMMSWKTVMISYKNCCEVCRIKWLKARKWQIYGYLCNFNSALSYVHSMMLSWVLHFFWKMPVLCRGQGGQMSGYN